jgi:hypothetical protein
VSARWHSALAYALIGVDLELPATEQPDLDALLIELGHAGWTAERIAFHAREVADAEEPWPHGVPDALRTGCGPAQYYAALTKVRMQLDLQTIEKRPPSVRRKLNPDEERLMREVPPHHGS